MPTSLAIQKIKVESAEVRTNEKNKALVVVDLSVYVDTKGLIDEKTLSLYVVGKLMSCIKQSELTREVDIP